MIETIDLESRLQSLTSLLISADADLTIHNSEGLAACSLIFKSQHGLPYLESFVYQYIDLFTLQEMTSVDSWILAALGRSFPTFQKRMESHLSSYRTPVNLSSCQNPVEQIRPQFEVEQQIAEVKRASVKIRTGFLRALCSRRTIAMVGPFLDCGINLNELESPIPNTYIRAAASQGNLDIVVALIGAGALVNAKSSYPEYGDWDPPAYRASSPVDDLLERWHSLRDQTLGYSGNPESEQWVLKKLLQNPTFNEPNVLFRAFMKASPPAIIKDLLDTGWGRRDNTAPASWCQKVNSSEVIEAVKSQNQVIPLLLEYGLAKECDDCFGFTALLHALDCGQRAHDSAQLLIDAGADLCRKTGSGFTPLELVKRNVSTQHPRWPMASRTLGKRVERWELDKSKLNPVPLEEDHHAYDLLIKAFKEYDGAQMREGWQSKSLVLGSIEGI
ncbi:hypothetical protein OEA41_000324 [Lepraria neglecta]|uniref:Ankyrin n=1 Tax=Lepraria neglecta TaxID=209136 RepID=A0AAD9ZGY7_9LECA|nr:hypothetical protein OEA41_000324 [Lepraria neglecta]